MAAPVSQDRQRQWKLRTESVEKMLLHLEYSGFAFTTEDLSRLPNTCLDQMLTLQRQNMPFLMHTRHRTDPKRVVCVAWVPGEKCGVRDLKQCMYSVIDDDVVTEAFDDGMSSIKLVVVSRAGETAISREAANEITKDNPRWIIKFENMRRLARHCNNVSD